MSERRRVHLLVPDESGTRLATDATGATPVVDLEFESGPTAPALDGWLLDHGAEATVVDYLIDQTSSDDDGTVHVVAELQLDVLPDGWRWTPLADVHAEVVSALQPYVSARLAEWRGAPTPPERSPWAQRGWTAALRAWVGSQAGVPFGEPRVRLVPFRLWGISGVWRVETSAGDLWCKAVCASFAAEPTVTQTLHRLRPDAVPGVVATDGTRRLLLMSAVGGTPVAGQTERTDDAIRVLVALQRDLMEREVELVAAGVARRPLGQLADDVAALLATPMVRAEVAVVDEAALLHALRDAVRVVDALGLTDTLVHGDFHAGNVLVDGERLVIIDWSDAAWTNPLVDVGAWASWFRDDPDTVDALWRTWSAEWGLAAERVDAARPSLDAVVGAYHFVSYARIAVGLEPLRRAEATGGMRDFFGDLLAATSR